MAEAALARREARRRKILENSHNRLQLITGKNDSENCKETSVITPVYNEISENSIPEVSSSINNCFLNNGVISSGEETFNTLSTNIESFALGDGDVSTNHDTAALISPRSTTPTSDPAQVTLPLWERIINYKYDIVLLSLFVQLLHFLSLVTFEGTYFFLPFISYVVTKYFWLPQQQNSSIANVLLLLNGMSANRAQKILSLAQYLSGLSQDVCIFLFTTICIQFLCMTL